MATFIIQIFRKRDASLFLLTFVYLAFLIKHEKMNEIVTTMLYLAVTNVFNLDFCVMHLAATTSCCHKNTGWGKDNHQNVCYTNVTH